MPHEARTVDPSQYEKTVKKQKTAWIGLPCPSDGIEAPRPWNSSFGHLVARDKVRERHRRGRHLVMLWPDESPSDRVYSDGL